MAETEAIERLKHHSYFHEDFESPRTQQGFLGMLRPFQGVLNEDNFHEVMQILGVLRNRFRGENVDRQLIANFWAICHFSRVWAIEKDGMLRRNNLIAKDQSFQLSVWLDCISSAIMCLLGGSTDEEAFADYKTYLTGN